MPGSLSSLLANEDDSNSARDVIPRLAHLLQHNRDVEKVYLCSESTIQAWKLPNEGAHFCGYRNIQMLLSGIPLDLPATHQKRSILELQNLIEKAWDGGFNSHGRVQTGGIRGTRRHIGTSEAEALVLSLGLSCKGSSFTGKHAWKELLDSVETYFASSQELPSEDIICLTGKPPVFLQRPKHSLTAIGIERMKSGKRRLLVFDPAWRAPKRMTETLGTVQSLSWSDRWMLRQYCKSEWYLRRFPAFETLEIDTQPPLKS